MDAGLRDSRFFFGHAFILSEWPRSSFRLSLLLCLLCSVPSLAIQTPDREVLRLENHRNTDAAKSDTTNSDTSNPDYSELCARLADPDQVQRERAFRSLKKAGITAFDELHTLRDSADLEQRMAASRLLQQAEIIWPDDLPIELRQMIQTYDHQTGPLKQIILEKIALTGTDEAAIVLAMMARYELDSALSRLAALNLIELIDNTEDSLRQAVLETQILTVIGPVQRTSTVWIVQRLTGHNDSRNFAYSWKSILDSELRRCDTLQIQHSGEPAEYSFRNEIAMRLALWVAAELAQRNQLTSADQVLDRIVSRIDPPMLNDVFVLLRQFNFATHARRIAQRFPDEMESDPLLMYQLAAVEMSGGSRSAAEQILSTADSRALKNPGSGIETAVVLQQFGYDSRAQTLFEAVIADPDASPIYVARSRLLLAEQLYRHGRYQSASKTLMPLAEALSENSELEKSIRKHIGCSCSQVQGRLRLFEALAARSTGNPEACRERIVEGLEHDSGQSDLLILAFHCSSFDLESKLQIDQLVSLRLHQLSTEMQSREANRVGPGNIRLHKSQNRQIAALANSYAWLTVNTRGDLELALEKSALANRLVRDNAAYLDTEARLRFACGDKSGAIECQRMACRNEPSSQSHKQQLAKYRRYRAATLHMPLASTIQR